MSSKSFLYKLNNPNKIFQNSISDSLYHNNKYGVKNLENGVEFYCDINLKGKEKIEDEVQ